MRFLGILLILLSLPVFIWWVRAYPSQRKWAMGNNHPMGVGANQYVIVADSKGYSQNAGVIWNSLSRGAMSSSARALRSS